MMDIARLEEQLSELPLYIYAFIDPKALEFSDRIRWICENECPMYGKTWACPPGVGSVPECKGKCLSYENCLMISTITEVYDIADMEATLATRPEHEEVTNQVANSSLTLCHISVLTRSHSSQSNMTAIQMSLYVYIQS